MEFRRSRNSREGKRRPRERQGNAIGTSGYRTEVELIGEETIRVFTPARSQDNMITSKQVLSLPSGHKPITDTPNPDIPDPEGPASDSPASDSPESANPAGGQAGADEPASPQADAPSDHSAPAGRMRQAGGAAVPVAIVGLACRYPDADDVAAFSQMIATGRRAFRRIPPCRVDLADYYSSDPATPDATYSTRAALIEGWRFDRAAFGISQATYASYDPAHWLALETAARVLAGAGYPGGAGLPATRTGAFIGNTLAGDVSRASALRLRWPYLRQVLADALLSTEIPARQAEQLLAKTATRYLAPFPPATAETLAGGSPGTIAAAVCGQLGLQGGGFTVDAGGASSLAAVTSACSALLSGELDVAIAGGVAVSLDPLSLVGLAKLGVLATGDMRVYDASPTGFLPGEGCGMVLLMRSSDATAAGLPIYAEILGWGAASAGQQRRAASDPDTMLLAMRKAYKQARIDPSDVGYFEGCGTGISHADEAELTALATLRAQATQPAVLGAVTASIGHTGAAAGAAGLIKSVMAAANGVLPPATGVRTPHQILREGGARLRTPDEAEPWPDHDVRTAAVSACSAEGLSVHLVLTSRPGQRSPGELPPGVHQHASRRPGSAAIPPRLGHPCTFLLQAADRATLTSVLARIADVAAWLSDAELRDLACQLAIEATDHGTARVAIVATRQEQLARLANEAITMLPKLTPGFVTTRPGIFAADGADGRVTLLLAGPPADDDVQPADQLGRAFEILRLLGELGVQPTAAVGHGVGQLAGLVWAGCASPAQARELCDLRTAALATPPALAHANVRQAIDKFATFKFQPPRHRLISGSTGTEMVSAAEVPSLLSAELLDTRSSGADANGRGLTMARLTRAVRASAAGATLLLQAGHDRAMTRAIGQLSAGDGTTGQRRKVPVVTIDKDPSDDRHLARAVAALFAAGALARPELLYAGRPARPIDLWREQVFITNPCQTPVDIPPNDRAQNVTSPGRQLPVPTWDAPPSRPEVPSQASQEPGAGRPADGLVAGVAEWARCYGEVASPVTQPGEGTVLADQPWAVFTGGCDFLRPKIEDLFRHEPGAERTLAVLGELPATGTLPAALLAARSAVGTGQLVVLSPDPGLTGFLATLRAEHKEVGVTAVRAALTPAGLEAASKIAVIPGQYRELVIGPDGGLLEPVMRPIEESAGCRVSP